MNPKIYRSCLREGYVDLNDTLIQLLEDVSWESEGGPMTFEAGEIEIADVEKSGARAVINWGCGQIAYLFGDQFRVLSALEKLAIFAFIEELGGEA